MLGMSLTDSAACGALCCVGSILPDIDSPQSKPSEMLFGLCSVIAPAFVLQSIGVAALTPAKLILYTLVSYVAVRFIVRKLFYIATVHRGMFHSIPMALIWGGGVYLAFQDAPYLFKNFAAASALIGYFVHLMVDELFSFVNIEGVRISPKQSFGTAIKFFSSSILASVFTYAALFMILYLSLQNAKLI